MQVIDPAKELARSLAKVLVHEGGYSNHPQDLGGHRGKNDKRSAGTTGLRRLASADVQADLRSSCHLRDVDHLVRYQKQERFVIQPLSNFAFFSYVVGPWFF